MKRDGLDADEEQNLRDTVFNTLSPALAQAGIDIANPTLTPENMSPRDAKLIEELLGIIGETDAERLWREQRLEKLLATTDTRTGGGVIGGTERLNELSGQIADLERRLRENPADLPAMQLLPTLQAEQEGIIGQLEHEGYTRDEILGTHSSIIPMPRNEQAAAAINEAGATPSTIIVAPTIKDNGNTVVVKGGDQNTSMALSQRMSSIGIPSFGGPGGLPAGVSG
jgi:hypothetical protein